MIDRARNLLFLHIARTGGTSVETALVGRDWWQIDPATKHISASQARSIHGEIVWRKFKKFTIVRNPWDRIVSMWVTGWWYDESTHLRGAKPVSMKEFLRTLKPHPHERYGSLHYHEILDEEMDFILRFESLQTDFSAMLKSLNQPDLVLPRVESRVRDDYHAYFDQESADLVAAIYQTDIRRFNYAF